MKEGIANPVFISSEDLQLHTPGNVKKDLEEEFVEGPCAWGGYSPRCVQCCNTPKGFLAFYCLLAIVQGCLVNGLVNVSISTIEKRYELNSSLTGLISSSYDIGFCVLSLFVSFYGERGHKPRWMAFSAFMIGLGAFVFSTPHYNTGIYKYGSEIKDTCAFPVSNSSEKSCDSSRLTTVSSYLYVFILGQLLMGVGGTALYTLGTAYIDDSVPSEKSSLYIGIGNGTAVLGPAIGYVAGGYILNIYIDINKGTTVDLTPEDPRWLGAWWIAFLISWPIAWLLVIPFCGFPKHLQGTAAIEQQKVSQAHQDGSEKVVLTLNVGKTFHDFPLALKLLVKNPVFVCLSIAASMEGFLIGGLATFIPKYIENQFGTTSSYAALLGGFVLIPGAALGQLIGGLVVSKFKLKCKQIIYFAIGTCIASFLMSMIFVVTKCKDIPFAGISVDYNRTGTATNLIAPCNAQCGCDNTYYNPVCGDDGIQYLSACNAGCRNISLQRNSMVFHNCSCVSFKHALSSENNRAFGGKCDTECNMKAAFTGLSLLFAIFTFMAATPNTTATLRCVPLTQRSFALGVQWVFIRLLGTIPGPMILGAAIDHTCILWNINSCGDKGACWSYNNTRMAYSLAIMCAVCKFLSTVFHFVASLIYNPPAETVSFKEIKEADLSSCTNLTSA